MSRSYTNIFLERSDEILLTQASGRDQIHLGDRVTIYLERGTTAQQFIEKLARLYNDGEARKEAKVAREKASSSKIEANAGTQRRIQKT